jgi:hypothetical protein
MVTGWNKSDILSEIEASDWDKNELVGEVGAHDELNR